MNKQKKKGNCLTTCLIIVAILCLFPIIAGFGWIAGAIWLIFFRKKLSTDSNKQKKCTIGVSIASVLSLFIFISAMITDPPSPTSLSLSSPMDGQALEIDNDYTINVQYMPDNASLSAVTYKIDNPSLASITTDSDNPAILNLHTKGEGTISITAIKGEIESNILSFDIINSARIEPEEIAEIESLQTKEEQTVTDSDIPEETENTTSIETEQENENLLGFEETQDDSAESLSEDPPLQATESSSNADAQVSVAQTDPILPETASSSSNTNEENLTTDSPVPATENPTSQTTGTASNDNIVSNSSGSNFDTYNNTEQQQTTDAYVLNTSRHKIHYPSCSSVPKIAPQNYATSNLSVAELEAQGYTTCGNCFR